MQSLSGQPSIDLFGFTIMEPMVMLTNFLITAVCIFAYIHLKKVSNGRNVNQYFRYYFIFMALATFFGGTFGHAFQHIFGTPWKLLGWLFGMISIFFISHASLLYAKPFFNRKFILVFRLVNAVALLSFAGLTIHTVDFNYVQFHSTFGFLALVTPLHLMIYAKTRNEGSKLMIFTICFTSLSAFIFTYKISLGVWFNHLDIAHTILALSMYFFYLASLKLEENPVINLDSQSITPLETTRNS